MGRIARGFHLLGISWDVLRTERQLMLLPLVSMGCFVVVISMVGGVAYRSGLFDDGVQPSARHYAAMFIVYFITYFIGIFFNAAVVACAMIRLDGGRPTLSDGLRMAYERIDKILGWAVIAATVGVVLRALEERAGLVGRIAIGLIGAAWAAVTFFVVPVLLFEPAGVADSIKRSSRLFKERWGEQLVGNGSIGLAMFLVSLPVIFAIVLLVMAAPVIGMLVGVVALGMLFSAGAAMSGIFNAALYRYAVSGVAVGGFAEPDLRGAFTARGRGGIRKPVANEFFADELRRHAELERERADGRSPGGDPSTSGEPD